MGGLDILVMSPVLFCEILIEVCIMYSLQSSFYNKTSSFLFSFSKSLSCHQPVFTFVLLDSSDATFLWPGTLQAAMDLAPVPDFSVREHRGPFAPQAPQALLPVLRVHPTRHPEDEGRG